MGFVASGILKVGLENVNWSNAQLWPEKCRHFHACKKC